MVATILHQLLNLILISSTGDARSSYIVTVIPQIRTGFSDIGVPSKPTYWGTLIPAAMPAKLT